MPNCSLVILDFLFRHGYAIFHNIMLILGICFVLQKILLSNHFDWSEYSIRQLIQVPTGHLSCLSLFQSEIIAGSFLSPNLELLLMQVYFSRSIWLLTVVTELKEWKQLLICLKKFDISVLRVSCNSKFRDIGKFFSECMFYISELFIFVFFLGKFGNLKLELKSQIESWR